MNRFSSGIMDIVCMLSSGLRKAKSWPALNTALYPCFSEVKQCHVSLQSIKPAKVEYWTGNGASVSYALDRTQDIGS